MKWIGHWWQALRRHRNTCKKKNQNLGTKWIIDIVNLKDLACFPFENELPSLWRWLRVRIPQRWSFPRDIPVQVHLLLNKGASPCWTCSTGQVTASTKIFLPGFTWPICAKTVVGFHQKPFAFTWTLVSHGWVRTIGHVEKGTASLQKRQVQAPPYLGPQSTFDSTKKLQWFGQTQEVEPLEQKHFTEQLQTCLIVFVKICIHMLLRRCIPQMLLNKCSLKENNGWKCYLANVRHITNWQSKGQMLLSKCITPQTPPMHQKNTVFFGDEMLPCSSVTTEFTKLAHFSHAVVTHSFQSLLSSSLSSWISSLHSKRFFCRSIFSRVSSSITIVGTGSLRSVGASSSVGLEFFSVGDKTKVSLSSSFGTTMGSTGDRNSYSSSSWFWACPEGAGVDPKDVLDSFFHLLQKAVLSPGPWTQCFFPVLTPRMSWILLLQLLQKALLFPGPWSQCFFHVLVVPGCEDLGPFALVQEVTHLVVALVQQVLLLPQEVTHGRIGAPGTAAATGGAPGTAAATGAVGLICTGPCRLSLDTLQVILQPQKRIPDIVLRTCALSRPVRNPRKALTMVSSWCFLTIWTCRALTPVWCQVQWSKVSWSTHAGRPPTKSRKAIGKTTLCAKLEKHRNLWQWHEIIFFPWICPATRNNFVGCWWQVFKKMNLKKKGFNPHVEQKL